MKKHRKKLKILIFLSPSGIRSEEGRNSARMCRGEGRREEGGGERRDKGGGRRTVKKKEVEMLFVVFPCKLVYNKSLFCLF